jgi:hypothetical protein
MPLARRLAVLATATFGCGDNTRPTRVLDQDPLWTLPGSPCFGNGGSAVGDLDGDGIPDLVVPTPNCRIIGVPGAVEPRIEVYRGTRTGFDSHPVVHIYTDIDSAPFDLQIGDINGDGRDDLMIKASGVSDLFLGTKDTTNLFDKRLDGAGKPGVFFDVDGDHHPEFLVTDGATVSVIGWSSDGLSGARGQFPGEALALAGDTDGDGRDDVYVRLNDKTIQLYRGCTKSTCVNGLPDGPFPVPVAALPINLGDVNGDHRADAVVLSDLQILTLHLADENGVLRETREWTLHPDLLYQNFRAVVPLGDVNGDGRADLGLSLQGRTMILFGGDSGPAAQPGWEWSLGHATDPDYNYDELMPIMYRDLDGDGYGDVIMRRTDNVAGQWNLIAYHGGQVPDGTVAPTLPAEQACRLRETATQPDITVDAELLTRSLRLRTVAFGPDACEIAEQCVGGPGPRRLLDFSVSVQNMGDGPALLPSARFAPQLYQYDVCHGHDHLIGFADYGLLNVDGTLRVAGHKQGFYPSDSASYCDRSRANNVAGDYLYISSGWADVYPGGIACQWIDVTDVPDGDYRLRVRVNASGVIVEDDQLPDEVDVPITIAGDRVYETP